jgi:hypothetical protein
MKQIDHTGRRSVYDGTDRLGDIEQRDAFEYLARDRLGRELGVFDTWLGAANAISKAAP